MQRLSVRRRGAFWRLRNMPTAVGRIVLIAISVVAFSPILLTFVLSVRSTQSIAKSVLSLPDPATLNNFATAWGAGTIGAAFISSVIATATSVLFLVVAGQLLAYVIVRRGARTGSALLVYVLVGLMIPFPTRVLPLFAAMAALHLTGSLLSVILFQCGSLMPLSVLLYAGFLRRIPIEYEEAAYIDGASHVRTVWSVVMPMLRPASGAVATLAGIVIWNDFFTPLMLVGGSQSATLPVAIYSFVGQYTADWGPIFAGITIAAVPVMVAFVLFQNYLVEGLGSGIKG